MPIRNPHCHPTDTTTVSPITGPLGHQSFPNRDLGTGLLSGWQTGNNGCHGCKTGVNGQNVSKTVSRDATIARIVNKVHEVHGSAPSGEERDLPCPNHRSPRLNCHGINGFYPELMDFTGLNRDLGGPNPVKPLN